MDNKSRGTVLPFLLTAVAVLLLGIRLLSQRADMHVLAEEARRAQVSSAVTSAERAVLLASYARTLSADRAVVDGIDARSGDTIVVRARDVDVVYVLAVGCPACEANLPLLDSLASAGVRVLGVSFVDDRRSLGKYGEAHAIKYPVLVSSVNGAGQTFEASVTPVTIMLNAGQMADLRVGRLVMSSDSIRALVGAGR